MSTVIIGFRMFWRCAQVIFYACALIAITLLWGWYIFAIFLTRGEGQCSAEKHNDNSVSQNPTGSWLDLMSFSAADISS